MARRPAQFDLIQHITASVAVDMETGCWNWRDSNGSRGYGKLYFAGKKRQAHRVMMHLCGILDIESQLFGCHRCDVRGCINPAHLFPGTNHKNVTDAVSKGRWTGQSKTHCRRGHPLTPENIHLEGRRRKCRKCSAIRSLASYHRRKQA